MSEFLPAGVFNVVCGERDTGRALIAHKIPAMVLKQQYFPQQLPAPTSIPPSSLDNSKVLLVRKHQLVRGE